MSGYSSVHGHRSMAFDTTRNTAYLKAIKQTVNSNSIVMDLGAGIGIHGLAAAKAGAKRNIKDWGEILNIYITRINLYLTLVITSYYSSYYPSYSVLNDKSDVSNHFKAFPLPTGHLK